MNSPLEPEQKKVSQYFIRHYLNKAILKQIFLRPQTRPSLVEHFGVRPNTISEHVNGLLRQGMIAQSEPIKTGGRDLVTLRINNGHSRYCGVMIDGEKTRGVTIGLAGEVVYQYSAVNPQPSASRDFVDNIIDVVTHLRDNSRGRIESICFAGEHFSSKDRSYHSEYVDDYTRVDFLAHVRNIMNLEPRFQSGIYAKTIAERWFGEGRGVDNFAFVNLGTGVSAGIVHRSILNQGAFRIGGQLGHTRRFSNKRCRCGRIGCLETVASVWAVKEFLKAHPEVLGQQSTRDLDSTPLSRILDSYLDAAVERKDAECLGHLKEMAGHWAIAIRNIVDLLAPGKVILGGTMLRAKDLILPIIESELRSGLFPFEDTTTPVDLSRIGEYNGAMGAAAFILQEIFSIPEPEYYFDLI
jgi:predicted NBD/HSP70 family sugar kinase